MLKENKVVDFLFNNKPSPFVKKTKLVIYKAKESDTSIINDIIKDVYSDVVFVKISNYDVIFIFGKYDVDIHNLFVAISDDLGYEVYAHDAIYINENISSDDIIEYVHIYDRCKKTSNMDIADVGLNAKEEDYFRFLDIISKSNFTYIYKDVVTIDIIEALLKNNLNVLQTSKLLYLHRNSILNKIEIIYKETGLNIQKFTNAYLVKQIICKR